MLEVSAEFSWIFAPILLLSARLSQLVGLTGLGAVGK
jgi:hypothetical protein